MRRKGLCLLLALAACHAPMPMTDEPATASRKDVTLALYRQLQLVLERHQELATEDSELAREEQDELVRLAAEIAVRIVRIDPKADVDGLVFHLGAWQ
jgi:hypothetical protein